MKTTNKNETTDIWLNVPKDDQGQPLEAPTDNSGYDRAAKDTCGIATHPVEKDEMFAIRDTLHTPPDGTLNLFTWGPEGAHVTIALERVPNSGGHNHGGATTDPKAVGTLAPNSFTLGPNYPQNVKSVYRAPTVCGDVRVIWHFSSGSPSTVEHRIEVLTSGFHPITASVNLTLKAPTAQHPSPYWGTPDFIAKLVNLANGYAAKTKKPITITDGCLVWGGRFDLQLNWLPPHAEHMNGHQADIRSNDMNDDEKKIFLQVAAQVGLSVLVESDHWHVRG